jgi:hypothetical protein
MFHTAERMAAGIPPPCSPLLHCSYEPGSHFSLLGLFLHLVIVSALVLGVPLLLRRANRGPDTGWWRRTGRVPDDPRPPSPDGGSRRLPEAADRSHRRRPRPESLSHTHRIRGRTLMAPDRKER